MQTATGPLAGVRVLEFSAIGPVPHAGMVLADLGADVVRIERPAGRQLARTPPDWPDPVLRGRRRVLVDLRDARGLSFVAALATAADVALEGLRPGAAERLGIGPDDLRACNDRLVYARMTGWGQHGPLSDRAGHDINYVALTGVLDAIGRPGDKPVPPLNLVGDFGGGSMMLVVGVLAALIERERSGRGQVIDAAIVDGTASLAQMIWSLRGAGAWDGGRGGNLLDGGAPFYDSYACADGRFVAVGSLEPQFYAALLAGLQLDPSRLPDRSDVSGWPVLRAEFSRAFAGRTRDQWAEVFAGADACVTPVLDADEAAMHPHMAHRGVFVERDGVRQAAPAPRFSRSATPVPPTTRGLAEQDDVLQAWSLSRPPDAG